MPTAGRRAAEVRAGDLQGALRPPGDPRVDIHRSGGGHAAGVAGGGGEQGALGSSECCFRA